MASEREREFYTTGQASKILGVSFRTLKRWIYSGKIKVTKTSRGWYKISKSEVDRLKADREREVDEFGRRIINFVKEQRITYQRALQVHFEDSYAQWDTYHKLCDLSGKYLKTRTYRGYRWYYPVDLKWKDVKGEADEKIGLIRLYADYSRRFTRMGVEYMDYSEFLVEQAMLQAGYTVVAKDTYYFNGIVYRVNKGQGRPRDLDYIAKIPGRDVYVGVQIKNRLEYPSSSEISQLIDICNILHLTPVLVARMSHEMRNLPVISRGGRVVIFKRYFLKPGFPRDKFNDVINMGIPIGVYKWPPEFLIRRFVDIAKNI